MMKKWQSEDASESVYLKIITCIYIYEREQRIQGGEKERIIVNRYQYDIVFTISDKEKREREKKKNITREWSIESLPLTVGSRNFLMSKTPSHSIKINDFVIDGFETFLLILYDYLF